MILEMMTVGPIETSCYIFGDEATGEVIVIDPGAEADRIKKYIKEKNLKLKCIVNTHGHADHIGANNDFNVPVWIHKDDADFLIDKNKNLSAYLEEPIACPKADKLLAEGDIIELLKELISKNTFRKYVYTKEPYNLSDIFQEEDSYFV